LSFPLVGNLSEPLFGKEGIGDFMDNKFTQKIPLYPPLLKGMLQRRMPDKPA